MPVPDGGAKAVGSHGENPPAQAVWQVLLPLPLAGAYDYTAPEGLTVTVGDHVLVPLGRRELPGVVWGPGRGDVAAEKLRPIQHRFAVPPMADAMRRFVDWVADYVMSPPGAVLRMALSVPAALDPPEPIRALRLSDAPPPPDLTWTDARRRVVALLDGSPPRPAGEIARDAGCSASVVHGLERHGVLVAAPLPRHAVPQPPDLSRPRATLEPTQEDAAARLRAPVDAGGFAVTLLDGVTGSGKTEVYFEAVAAALAAGRQVLVLLPEIALSAQWLGRFADRFGVRPVEWHSDLTSRTRRAVWRAVALGDARVVVGARSALFLPFPELGLIVVDEEHDQAFKQEDGVLYHARDMAVVRARLADIPVVLVSATPSLETVINVSRGRYDRVALPERHGGARLPEAMAIDLRATQPPRGRFLAPPLVEAIADGLQAGEQTLLFLNRRGYAPMTLCRACGHRFTCPQCSAWLVDHRLARRLVCHHCGFSLRPPPQCPNCGAEDSLVPCGPGVERIEEEVATLFPEARRAIMSSDQLHGPAAAAEMVRRIGDHEVDIVIGTQLIAKGHHFPDMTLVGVVDADLGLAGGDLRAGERTHQLLTQVAGRAGRGDRPGRVLIQTHGPEHPAIAALLANDRDRFLAVEADARHQRALPPFGRLVAIIVSGPQRDAVENTAAALARTAPRNADVTVLGPADAPLAVLRGRHRRRLLVKAPRRLRIQPIVASWLATVRVPSSVRVTVDVDPYSFL